jgi:hypothetical protein
MICRVGKGFSVTRKDCSTYGLHSPHRPSSLTFPGPHSLPLRLPQTRMSFIPCCLLPPHLFLFLLPTRLPFQACSRCTSGEETTSITVDISPTGPYRSWASMSFPGFQTGSRLLPTKLTRVYSMTNGRPEWLQELKDALQEDARREGLDEWEHIGTSRDLRLTGEQKHNSQAVDMAVGQRAEVFIGNGVRLLVLFVAVVRVGWRGVLIAILTTFFFFFQFSSLTSNVVMLRAAQGYHWDKSRFW